MATYSELSAAERRVFEELDRQTRAWLRQLARLLVQARALDAAWSASGGGDAILARLTAGELVPDASALAGVQDLTKEEWQTMRTAGLADFLTSYDTLAVRRVLAKAGGPTAGLSD